MSEKNRYGLSVEQLIKLSEGINALRSSLKDKIEDIRMEKLLSVNATRNIENNKLRVILLDKLIPDKSLFLQWLNHLPDNYKFNMEISPIDLAICQTVSNYSSFSLNEIEDAFKKIQSWDILKEAIEVAIAEGVSLQYFFDNYRKYSKDGSWIDISKLDFPEKKFS